MSSSKGIEPSSASITELLADVRENAPEELHVNLLEFEDFWERKLWHELTMSLLTVFKNAASAPYRLKLFNGFVCDFKNKISATRLIELGFYTQETISNLDERLEFVQSLAKEVDSPNTQEALLYALNTVAQTQLQKETLPKARETLDKCQEIMDCQESIQNVIRALFYKVNAMYYKSAEEFTNYFRTTLLYLACIELNTISVNDQKKWAHDLCISALISDQIYNYGELLLNPILDCLKDSPDSWLRDLIIAFNKGDILSYNQLSVHIRKDETLSPHEEFLNQKISLAALMEAVFRRPPHKRAMTFAAIAKETNIEYDSIEPLIMKALSLDLVRGKIDQVDEIARIHWVQPKVLDMQQIEAMRQQLNEWNSNINRLGTWIEGLGRDVWTT